MDDEYFDEFEHATAYQVGLANWTLYDGIVFITPTGLVPSLDSWSGVIGAATEPHLGRVAPEPNYWDDVPALPDELVEFQFSQAPTEAFRIAITVSAVEGHEVVTGTVLVNDEELDFTEATRLTTTEELTELPAITIADLDCNVLVECISTTGAPLQRETLTAIDIVCFPKTHMMRDPSGSGYMETTYDIYTNAALHIGDQIRYTDPHQGTTINLYVKNPSSAVDLEDNSQPFRVYNCA